MSFKKIACALFLFGAASFASARPSAIQFFGIFDGEWDVAWEDRAHAATPWDELDYLYIAFAHSYEDGSGKYILSYENARNGDLVEGDTDADRIDYIVSSTRSKNPNAKILISLGWGMDDIRVIVDDPEYYAESVVEFIREHDLDGFDIDFESQLPTEEEFTTISRVIRDALDVAGLEDHRPYLLTLTPYQTAGYQNWKYISSLYDRFNVQTYTQTDLALMFLGLGVPEKKITVGCLTEGYTLKTYDIDRRLAFIDEYGFTGLFCWRLDTDMLDSVTNIPSYAHAKYLWDKIHAPKTGARRPAQGPSARGGLPRPSHRECRE